jgi:hypothetical protein
MNEVSAAGPRLGHDHASFRRARAPAATDKSQ